LPEDSKPIVYGVDNSILHLIPPVTLPTSVIIIPETNTTYEGSTRLPNGGKAESDIFLILEQSASSMIESEPILEKEPIKHY